MSLRLKISAVILLVVAMALAAATLAHLLEVSTRLEEQLGRQVDRVVSSITTEMKQSGDVLDEEMELALDPSGEFARSIGSTRATQRFLSAQNRLQKGRLELLKVLRPKGQIITSGHWPASYGALDPNIELYKTPPGKSALIVDEPTASGSRPSLQRWTQATWGRSPIIIVVGRFLDRRALERLRERSGADLLSFCRSQSSESCVTVRNEDVVGSAKFKPNAGWVSRLELAQVTVGGEGSRLYIGLDRSPLEDVGTGLVLRAVVVGLACTLLALIFGVFIASRIVRPVEALAGAADRLAEGDLSARVVADKYSGPEVTGLVTAFNSMAEDMERSQLKLKQAERVAAWREIARGLAHELKNPLTPILGAMDVIRKARKLQRADFDDILNEQADALVEEVMRLKELADAFARFARLPEPKIEEIDLAAMLEHTIALYGEGEVEVVRRFESHAPVEADRTQMNSVVSNLIKNAIEAMEAKGTLYLGLRGEQKEGRAFIVLEVGDSGPGIAKEIKDRLFTPYMTTKGSRGTGLGLALVHRIVAEHGGDIDVGRSEGGGALFSLRLPQKQLAQSSPKDSVSL